MRNKPPLLYILTALFLTAGFQAFADQPASSDDKTAADTSTNAEIQVPAVPAVPADTAGAQAAQPTYLYDLKKLIEKSKENIKEVNEKIKEEAILKRNQQREERAREYYEKGLELSNEGKLDEAREYFEKAIQITEHPEMNGYIRESQIRLKREEGALESQEHQHENQIKEDENTRRQEVEEAYREAVELYKEKKYHPAKDAFDHVDEIAPEYRATDSYLKIIDQDIIMADAVAAKQQAVEMERQQHEAEAARAKEKQMWLQQLEEKEKERKESIEKQAEDVYDMAVDLYKQKKFAEAKKKFEEVSWVIPDYKKTMWYLGRIDHDAQVEQERVAEEQKKILAEQQWEEIVEQKKQEAQREKAEQAKEARHRQELEDQAQFLYGAAVNLYDQNKSEEALEKFNDIEKLCPDFKSTRMYIARLDDKLGIKQKIEEQNALAQQQAQEHYDQAMDLYHSHQWAAARAQFYQVEQLVPDYKRTRHYLQKIDVYIAREPGLAAPSTVTTSSLLAATVGTSPAAPAVNVESQEQQAQDIAALAQKSAELYRQIADVADDRLTRQTERKMARVEDIMNSLKASQDRILRRMQEVQWKQQQEESQAKHDERVGQAEQLYEQAIDLMRSRAFSKAKIEFLAVENVMPDYKNTRRYLSHIDEDIQNANDQAVTDYEQAEAEHLKVMQDKQTAMDKEQEQEAEQKAQMLQVQQEQSLEQLAQKASDINDAIISLSKTQDLAAMKAKFIELENTVTALTTLKDEMAKAKDQQARQKELEEENRKHQEEAERAQKQEARQMKFYATSQSAPERLPILSQQPSDSDFYKRREVMQEQNDLFNEGVDRYEHHKYTQARLLFGELADQNDRRAEAWLKKVDRAITQQLLRSQESEERERTDFLEDQVKAQRELLVIQERERQRQKKLTEELERQKRLYEDDRLLQLRKEEILKTQERERQRQEAKRLRAQEEAEKKAEALRFHRVENPTPAPAPVATPAPAPVVVSSPAAATPAPAPTPAPAATMTPEQIKAQVEISDERKAYLDKKYEQEQKEKEREDRIKAAQDAREKRIQEREEARQAKIKAAAEEAKRREELKQQQEEQREEKIKEAQIMREEAARTQELEREERDRQAQLEAQRESIRKQLEDGVESMYQDAVNLYNQGNYSEAADRFKDIQDILPGYKHSEQYMDEARQKAMAVNPAPPTSS